MIDISILMMHEDVNVAGKNDEMSTLTDKDHTNEGSGGAEECFCC